MHSSTESLDNKSDTINITLKNKDANNSPSQNPEAITYILELNKGLLQENQKLIAKITQTEEELKKKDEELEDKDDDMGREERTNVHLKGLLKNFLEMSRLHQDISDERKQISDKNYKSLKDFKTNMFSIRYSLLALYGVFLTINFMLMPLHLLCMLMIYTLLPIGIMEYFSCLSSPPIQLGARIAGISPDCKQGLDHLSIAARKSHYSWIEASNILTYAYLHIERDYDKADYYVSLLMDKFPGHPHFALLKGEVLAKSKRWTHLDRLLPKLDQFTYVNFFITIDDYQ